MRRNSHESANWDHLRRGQCGAQIITLQVFSQVRAFIVSGMTPIVTIQKRYRPSRSSDPRTLTVTTIHIW